MFVFPQMAGSAPPQQQYGAPQYGAPQQSGGGFPPTPDHYEEVRQTQTEPTVYRILCPKGHELQTPAEMLGTKAQCPYCNAIMELKIENSVEHREELQRQQRILEQRQQMREEAQGRFWLRVAIAVGVLAVGGLVGAVIYLNR